jgi:hypothetical protein
MQLGHRKRRQIATHGKEEISPARGSTTSTLWSRAQKGVDGRAAGVSSMANGIGDGMVVCEKGSGVGRERVEEG